VRDVLRRSLLHEPGARVSVSPNLEGVGVVHVHSGNAHDGTRP
jgi:hypothetical protein